MKIKLVIAVVAIMALTGCATRTGTAIVAGATGMVIGSAISQPRIVHSAPVVIVDYHHSHCWQYAVYSERVACERGVRQRYYEEQRRRVNEAYRSGYGR